MKKTLPILFIFIFLLQALPVIHWVYGPAENNLSIEMTDDRDNDEKDNTQKEEGKDSKENIIPHKHSYNRHLVYKSTRLALLSSGNAIIMHHADISTPPPDING